MRPPKISPNAFVLGLIIFFLLGAAMWLIVSLLNAVEVFDTRQSTLIANLKWINWIAMFASVASLNLLAIMIMAVVQDYLSGRRIIQLFWAMLMFKALWAAIITLTSLPALDRILHGERTWTFVADPEVQLFYVLLFLLVAIVTYWMAFIIYRGRFF